ncbi:helix-turn-helix domain-containing protein [Paenibacillus thalictri]|nr:helix-turn-helix domain-containing protein [Paenibacillus thalictri]
MTNDHQPFPAGPASSDWISRMWIRLVHVFEENDKQDAFRLLHAAAPSYMLIAAAKRHGNIVIDGILSPITPGIVHVIRPGQRLELRYPSDGEQVLYGFHFDIYMPEENGVEQALISWVSEETIATASARLIGVCEKITVHWHSGDATDRLVSQAGFQELLHLLLKKQGHHEDALDQARDYLRSHYRDEITVERLSESAGMSRYHFMRSFKDRFGQSVIDYLTELRTNQAKLLMEEGRSLRDIAGEVGYKDPLYFSSQFKKHVGISPSIYMANRKCKTAAYSWPNLGHLLALQIIPYAAPIDQSWTDDYRKRYRYDVKVPLSHDYEFNRKALWRARPDRIVALEEMITDEEKIKLQQIAPVLFLPWQQETWRVHLQMTARFLDKEQEGEKWLSRYDDKADAVREKIPDAFRQGGLLILHVSARGIKIWGKRAGTVLYDDLQVGCAGGVERIRYTEFIEAEQLADFMADVVLMNVMKDRQSQMNWSRLKRSEHWQRLNAVQNRHVYVTSGLTWFGEPIMEYTAYQHYRFLQQLDLLFCARG